MASPEILWIPRRIWEIGRGPEVTEINIDLLSQPHEGAFRRVFDELVVFQFDAELIQHLGRCGYKENFLNYLQRWKWSATTIEGPHCDLLRTNYFSQVLMQELAENY